MKLVQVLDVMQEYSLKVLILAALVCGLTSIIKIWIPDSKKKFLTFVPFILGIIVYSIYLLIAEGASEILKPDTILSGFECGAAATIYYVLYEQFIRNKTFPKVTSKEALAVMGILNNTVKPECLEGVSEKIANLLKDSSYGEEALTKLCAELIIENGIDETIKKEVDILVKLIIKTIN